MKHDVAADPIDVGDLGSPTLVLRADRLAHAVKELRRKTSSNRVRRRFAAGRLSAASFHHFADPPDDDGIVGANRSTAEAVATKTVGRHSGW
jgi:hypothetical protein